MTTITSAGSWEAGLKNVKLHKATVQYLTEKLQFPHMVPVQAKTIPLLLTHQDVVVEAVTGSGKTLAYVIPCVEFLLSKRCQEVCRENRSAVIAVILLPSRELAQQVFNQVNAFLSFLGDEYTDSTTLAGSGSTTNQNTATRSSLPRYCCQCFIGGRSIDVDVELVNKKGAHVLIGTPGRMYELLVASKYASLFNLGHLELAILDEADKLLEFGFKAKLDALLKRLPKQRRTGLFSATQTKELADLARAGMRNPVSVMVRVRNLTTSGAGGGVAPMSAEQAAKPQVPEQIVNYFAVEKHSTKLDRLMAYLAEHANEKVIVYMLTCAAVDWLYEALRRVLMPDANLCALHGQMEMPVRRRVHTTVTNAKSCVLVCTDVAARGLDIPEVTLVVQYDPPVDPHTFIHRIGRTGRMGRQGTSLVLLLPQEVEYVPFLKLQNVALMPLDPLKDDLDVADDEAKNVDKNRTLASSSREPPARKALGAMKRVERRQVLREAKLKQQQRSAQNKKRSTTGDLCESPSILALRRAAREIPELLPLGARAFVSYIRAYKEHECRYIFQLKHLDLTDLTHSFGLFKIPNCGEIRHMNMLKLPIQDEFQDVLQRLAEEKRQKREEADKKRALEEAEALEAEETEGLVRKKHRTERQEDLEALKTTRMSKAERSRQWKAEEIREIMRDAYYVKKEKRGYIKSRVVDEKLAVDALENAKTSTRERALNRKISQKKR